MVDQEEIKAILLELKKALSGPTKKETKEIADEIEKNILNAKKSQGTTGTVSVQAQTTDTQPVQAKPYVQEKPRIIIHPDLQIPNAPRPAEPIPQNTPDASVHSASSEPPVAPCSIFVKEKGQLPKSPIIIDYKPPPDPSPATSAPAQPPVTEQPAVPKVAPAPKPADTSPEAVAPKIVQYPETFKMEVPSKLEKGQIRIACFYPYGDAQIGESFLEVLLEILRKTSKKNLNPETPLKQEIDQFKADWQEIINECRKMEISTVFLIDRGEYKTEDLKNKFSKEGIFFYNIDKTRVSSRMMYVDLAIEMTLTIH